MLTLAEHGNHDEDERGPKDAQGSCEYMSEWWAFFRDRGNTRGGLGGPWTLWPSNGNDQGRWYPRGNGDTSTCLRTNENFLSPCFSSLFFSLSLCTHASFLYGFSFFLLLCLIHSVILLFSLSLSIISFSVSTQPPHLHLTNQSRKWKYYVHLEFADLGHILCALLLF